MLVAQTTNAYATIGFLANRLFFLSAVHIFWFVYVFGFIFIHLFVFDFYSLCVLQRPEALERLDQYKRKISRKKVTLSARII